MERSDKDNYQGITGRDLLASAKDLKFRKNIRLSSAFNYVKRSDQDDCQKITEEAFIAALLWHRTAPGRLVIPRTILWKVADRFLKDSFASEALEEVWPRALFWR